MLYKISEVLTRTPKLCVMLCTIKMDDNWSKNLEIKVRVEGKMRSRTSGNTCLGEKCASSSAGSYYTKTTCKFSWFQKVEYHHLLSFSNYMFSLKVNIALYSETAECKGESGS